jgi:hypothetical protein
MIRLFNRVLALVIGAILAAGGALVIIEGFWTWTNSGFVWIPGEEWLSAFKTTPWSARIVIAVSAAVAAAGFLLLLLELRPHPKRVIPFQTQTAGEWLLIRRSTEAHLQRRLSAKVPTTPIRVRIKSRSHRWSLTVKARAASSIRPVLQGAGRSELALLHAPESCRVRVQTARATRASNRKKS